MSVRELKIGTSWVRGVVGDALPPELIVNFSCAFGTWCGGEAVVIGRDTRNSSLMLRSAVIAGLLSCGCEVIDLGISSSPLLSFAVRDLGASGGISISGSHNGMRWNALKFFGSDGVLLSSSKSEELMDLYHASAYLRAPWDCLQPVATAQDIVDRYLDHLVSCLDLHLLRSRRFRVAMDFCNGACGVLASRFLQQIGCSLLPLNEDPTGEFAHDPAPSIANMRQLSAFLRCVQTDLGAAINIDGDRLGLAAADGAALSEEYVLPLTALHRLAYRPGLIVTSLSTSRMVEAVARRFNQGVIRVPIGEGSVMDRGLAEGASLAGEGSGGVAALPISMSFDALLTLGMILESLAGENRDLASFAEEIPRLAMRKGSFPCPPEMTHRVLEGFQKAFLDQDLNTTDGVRIQWDDAWLHIRASNTEPILRIIAEAQTTERADTLYTDAMNFARRIAFRPGG